MLLLLLATKFHNRYDVDHNGSIDVLEFSSLIFDAYTTGELQYTLTVDKLSSWARKTDDKTFAVGYFELDKWMSAMVSDESPLSIYERGAKADLYRALLDECPYLIDFAASAPCSLIAELRRFLFLLEKVQDVTHISGLMAEYIVEIDRSSVFYWLTMRASEMQRKTFLSVLVDVHNTQNKMNALNPCGWSHSMRRLQHKLQSKHKMGMLYPTERVKEILFANIDEIDRQLLKEQKVLIDNEKWRILEKSNFRPTDISTQSFKKEKFLERWSLVRAKMALVTTRKAVAPEPTDKTQAMDNARASSKSDSIPSTTTKRFSSRHKVAPAPSERAQPTVKADAHTKNESQHVVSTPVSLMPKETQVGSHGKKQSPRLEGHSHSNDAPRVFPGDRNRVKSSNSDSETDSHGPARTSRGKSLVKIEQDATIHEL